MKKTFTFLMLSLLFLAINAFGQSSIVITPKKTVYTRTGKGLPKEKRTFTVRYLMFNGAMAPAVKTKLENTLSYWRVFDRTLKDCLADDCGLDSFDYKVNYNQNGILSVTLMDDHSGAYPDMQSVDLVIDLKTGAEVKFADAFNSDAKLAEMVNQKLEVEKKGILKEVAADKEQNKEAKEWATEQINGLSFTTESFKEFRMSPKGVIILYDAEFPHAIQSLQPAGEYLFTYAELKPFIKKNSLLGKIVR